MVDGRWKGQRGNFGGIIEKGGAEEGGNEEDGRMKGNKRMCGWLRRMRGDNGDKTARLKGKAKDWSIVLWNVAGLV